MKKILVIRLSAIGDIVLATSFLESVKQKYPDSEIHFLIKKEFSDIVKKHPIIDKLISFDKKLAGKSLTSFNVLLFSGTFFMQWGIGLIIDLSQFLGKEEVLSFQISFTVYLIICIFSYLYFIMKNKNE